MNYFKFLLTLFFMMFPTGSQLFAIMYEDAEDKKNDRWQLLDASSHGTVENVYDKNTKSRVIQLKGEGTKSAYKLMIGKDLTEDKKILSWQMKYSEDFVIIVGMDTKGGKRYLIYTPSGEDGYMQYGLGEKSRSGVWQRFNRNLQEDLDQFEELNDIKRVHSFVIRGSGSIDNIEMLKKFKLKSSTQSTKKKLNVSPKSNNMPSIYIFGENPMHLRIGEAFVDSGARAYDKEDGELLLISSEEIDINKEGEYSVMYIATDSMGNTAVDTRYVKVGESSYSEAYSGGKVEVEEEQMVAAEEEHYEDELKLEERELEILEWEKELEVREKKIIKREYRMQNFSQFQTGQLQKP
ncbi:DUF5011 domain-containing protein [bacterium]|nr:DUF5011 domain-containing protein [bacterium]MBU1958865.1 DUF5011 domain-containing protein [bacterium]